PGRWRCCAAGALAVAADTTEPRRCAAGPGSVVWYACGGVAAWLEWGAAGSEKGSMFLRLLFVLLIALNIAVGAWLLLGQPYARGGSATDPDVAELRLLSELPEPAATVPTPGAMAAT